MSALRGRKTNIFAVRYHSHSHPCVVNTHWQTGDRPRLMLGKCFNPSCTQRLLRLRDGRVVRTVRADGDISVVEHFWLCGDCYLTYDFSFGQQGSVSLVKRSGVATSPSAATDSWLSRSLIA